MAEEGTAEGVEVEVGEAASDVEAAQVEALGVGADEERVGPLVVVQGAEDVVEAPDVVRGRSTSSPTTKGVMTMVRSSTSNVSSV